MTCTWTEDFEGCWNTSCGHAVVFEYRVDQDKEYRFCAYCGKAIEFVAYTEEDEEP